MTSEAQRAKPKVRRRRTEGDQHTSRRSEAKGERNEANMSRAREDCPEDMTHMAKLIDSYGKANWTKQRCSFVV